MEEVQVSYQWMVLARHLGMPGGVFDYGVADIKGFYDTFEEANNYGKKLFDGTHEGLAMPTIWILRCEVTYKEGVIITSKGE